MTSVGGFAAFFASDLYIFITLSLLYHQSLQGLLLSLFLASGRVYICDRVSTSVTSLAVPSERTGFNLFFFSIKRVCTYDRICLPFLSTTLSVGRGALSLG